MTVTVTCPVCHAVKDYTNDFYAGASECRDCMRASATARRAAVLPPAPTRHFNRVYSGLCDLCDTESDDLRLRRHHNMAAYICPDCRR